MEYPQITIVILFMILYVYCIRYLVNKQILEKEELYKSRKSKIIRVLSNYGNHPANTFVTDDNIQEIIEILYE